MSNHDGEMGHHSLKASSVLNTVGSELMSQPWAPTEEEIAEEEEAARAYQVRRNLALKKKEAQQEREMARILEERRAMEEELEELRLSTRASSSAAANITQGLQGTSVNGSANSSNANNVAAAVAEVQAAMSKRMSRMKKKYDKKLAAAKEALEDLQAVSTAEFSLYEYEHRSTLIFSFRSHLYFTHFLFFCLPNFTHHRITKQDFSYERKQFADAAAEQEKDVRLYELICQSVLSEKDLKKVNCVISVKLVSCSCLRSQKFYRYLHCILNSHEYNECAQIIEKCRYDEDADEWIIPFTKKKTISDSQWQQAESNTAGAGGNRSLLPDIGAKGGGGGGSSSTNNSGNNLHSLSSTLRDPSKIHGKSAASQQGREGNSNSSEGRPSPVPLLTLPGNLMTPASLVSPVNSYHGGGGSSGGGGGKADKGGFLPQISSRSDANSSRNAAPDPFDGNNNNNNNTFSQLQILPSQGLEKKKKPKNKVPKSQGNPSSGMGAGVGYAALSSARSQQGDEYVDITDNDLSGGSSSVYAGVAENKENGTADFAGPVEDWGFVFDQNQLAAHGPGKAGNGPELEYSDDEDFESTEDIISSSQYKSHDGPYPPAYGNGVPPKKGGKKKRKVSQQDDVNSSNSGNNSKGGSSFALPPI